MSMKNDPRVPGGAHRREREDRSPGTRGGIFWRFALRSLKLSRARTIVSIIGIALSCALITAIFTSVTTMLDSLLTATINREGSWQAELTNMSEDQLERLDSNEHVTDLYIQNEYGSALMPFAAWSSQAGHYLSLQAWPDKNRTGDLICAPKITSGRAPEKSGEIVLPSNIKNLSLGNLTASGNNGSPDDYTDTGKNADTPTVTWDGVLTEGTTVSLALGQRVFQDTNGNRVRPMRTTESLYTEENEPDDPREASLYHIMEWLTDVQPMRPYTVVGFFSPEGMDWRNDAGILGLVSPKEQAPVLMRNVFFSTDLRSYTDFQNLLAEYTGDTRGMYAGATTSPWSDEETSGIIHDGLIRYQGMTDNRAIWGTLYQMAAILAVVVLVASVSLIYNSFAIAVSERTRQYGLLASLGASRRQLRRTVYAEAAMLALAGIPTGLVLGLAGTWVVFQFAGEGLGALVDQKLYADSAITSIVVRPSVLAFSAAIALATVFVSAAVPALRASRVSAVDALRQSRDVKLNRRDRRRQRKLARAREHGAAAAVRGPLLDRLRLHMGGIPAFMAHRNLTRATSKGRVAVASLAVSVALLITSGSISQYMGTAVATVDKGVADISIYVSRLLNAGETAEDGLSAIATLGDELAEANSVSSLGYEQDRMAFVHAPRGIMSEDINGDGVPDAGTSFSDYATSVQGGEIVSTSGSPTGAVTKDGEAYLAFGLAFVDDSTWHRILADNGLDAKAFAGADTPIAVGVNGLTYSVDGKYATRDPFASTGDVDVYTEISSAERNYFYGVALDDLGQPCAAYQSYDENMNLQGISDPDDPLYGLTLRPLTDAAQDAATVRIVGMVTELPSGLQVNNDVPTLVLPVSELAGLSAASGNAPQDSPARYSPTAQPFLLQTLGTDFGTSLSVNYFVDADDDIAAEEAIERVLAADATGDPWDRSYVTNYTRNQQSTLLAFQAVQMFINCFVIITGAIAVANVFNTLSSSIILRRREFAVLRSAGMGPGAFRRMIAHECASYAWRGLAIGLALATVVAFMLYQAMKYSFYGLEFTLPWAWVAGAVAVVLGVLLASVLYALRKSRSDSIVEALREDAL